MIIRSTNVRVPLEQFCERKPEGLLIPHNVVFGIPKETF